MNTEEIVELLVVDDCFQIRENGVVLAPDFPLPIGNGWREFTFFVTVVNNYSSLKFRAIASPIHLHVIDPTIKRRGWRLTIVLPSAKKENISIGSKVFCSAASYERIFGVSSKPN